MHWSIRDIKTLGVARWRWGENGGIFRIWVILRDIEFSVPTISVLYHRIKLADPYRLVSLASLAHRTGTGDADANDIDVRTFLTTRTGNTYKVLGMRDRPKEREEGDWQSFVNVKGAIPVFRLIKLQGITKEKRKGEEIRGWGLKLIVLRIKLGIKGETLLLFATPSSSLHPCLGVCSLFLLFLFFFFFFGSRSSRLIMFYDYI